MFAIKSFTSMAGACLALTATSFAGMGMADSDLHKAFKEGKTHLKLRLRYENVDQEGIAARAHALTLRSLLGYHTADFHGFSAMLEAEDVTRVGDSKSNLPGSAPANISRDATRPVIADPKGTEINQVFAQWQGEANRLRFGRQEIAIDNQRFVGPVGWRQNWQTFDAATWSIRFFNRVDLLYGYIDNVNTITRSNTQTQTHLFNLTSQYTLGDVQAYAYLLDDDNTGVNDHNTFGLSFDGGYDFSEAHRALWRAEWARQMDAAENTLDYDVDYLHLIAGGTCYMATLKVGYELLGTDNNRASFSTPLATKHKFNGWADAFLTTPIMGLEDTYVDLSLKLLKDVKLGLAWHDFGADKGGDFGDEIDAQLTWKTCENSLLGLKYADYSADTTNTALLAGVNRDVQKFWAWIECNF